MTTPIREVRLEPFDAIDAYANIPTAFRVESVLQPRGSDEVSGGFVLDEHRVAVPYVKNYDAIPDNRPGDWSTHLDTTHWQLFAAFEGDVRVGGAIAFVKDAANTTSSRAAELWDLRVHPDWRRRGMATELFHAVEEWARQQACARLLIETQNVNVAACRFYERQGCSLRSVRAGAYAMFSDEIRLVWQKVLC